MGIKTEISWTDSTWSPIRARVRQDAPSIAKAKGYTSLVEIAMKMRGHVGQHCEHVSPGCEHCYAETNNHRCLPGNGTGLPYDRRSRDLVEAFVDEKVLMQPLKWGPVFEGIHGGVGVLKEKRHRDGSVTVTRERPRRIFVENQSDLFGEWVTDEMLDRVFAVMALCPQHTFQVLTKRPERMLAYFCQIEEERDMQRWVNAAQKIAEIAPRPAMVSREHFDIWPLPNVWLGVSDEGNRHERIDILREIPAAVRFISFEPLITDPSRVNLDGIDWVICGGESGPGARQTYIEEMQSIVDQCRAASVRCFVKQLGGNVIQGGERRIKKDKKGGDWNEWPHELRVREFPEV